MAMRAASSPGCGDMHSTPTSAVSSACKTPGGATVIGRGPKSSSNSPVYRAFRSSSAAAILAATARLASSAINATCSPGRTARQVSTALCAPGINSVWRDPKFIVLILLESARFSSAEVLVWFYSSTGRKAGFQSIDYRAAWGNSKRGDLAAAAGDIRQAGGAETRQKAAQFSAEQIRRKVHQHVPVVHLADVGGERKDLAADRNAFLRDPHAIFRRQRALDGAVPRVFTGLPAKRHARTAVLIARFQYQVFALLADKREQLHLLPVMRRLDVRDDARPGNVIFDEFAFAEREKRTVLFIRQHREKSLHVRNFAAEVVRYAHRIRRVGLHQRRAFDRLRNDVVDQHAAVDEINYFILSHELFSVEFKLAWFGDERGHAHSFETLLKNLEFTPRRHTFPIHNRDLRRRQRTAPVLVTRQKGFKKFCTQRVAVDLIPLRKFPHDREFPENLRQAFRIPGARRRFAVVFGELQRIRKQERVEPGCCAGRPVAGGHPREPFLFGPEMQLRK